MPMKNTECEKIADNLIRTLDNRRHNGLLFSKFTIQATKNILAKIKTKEQQLSILCHNKDYKKINEEIIPISVYVLSKYSCRHQMAIEWKSGNQPYDAIAYDQIFKGKSFVKSKTYLEVTTLQHKNNYLVKEDMIENGMSCGPHKIQRLPDKKIKSEPVVLTDYEDVDEMIDLLCDRIKEKESKRYKPNTVLIISCRFPCLFLDYEWAHFEDAAKKRIKNEKFQSIFIYENLLERKFEINRA